MFMYAVKKPAVAAAAALGEDGTAVFCEGPGLLFASARGEAPDAGITTAIFNVEKGEMCIRDRCCPRSSCSCSHRWSYSSASSSNPQPRSHPI